MEKKIGKNEKQILKNEVEDTNQKQKLFNFNQN